jgi:hypothetical protein
MLSRIPSVTRNRIIIAGFRRFSGPTKLPDNATPEQVQAYLRQANATMEQYHYTRELARQGKLLNKNAHYGPAAADSTGTMQLGIVAFFLVAFACTPLVGKKMAQDPEFRSKFAWYDYTVRKPEAPWTRQELHEQMVAVEKELRERAIQGDFDPEKLDALQRQFRKLDRKGESSNYPSAWDRIHPGLEKGEKLNEDD